MSDPMDDFDTGIDIDDGMPAALVAVVAIVSVVCVLAAFVTGMLVAAVLR